jgi:hypothetical protein
MDDLARGLPPRNIYPEPAARGSYDAQGRLAGYFHGVLQGDGSKALPPPQASGRDKNAFSVYGQESLPYFVMNKGYPQCPTMYATPFSGASRSAFQAPTARMTPDPQQPNGWTSMPPPPPPPSQQQQQASGVDTSAPSVYGQTFPYNDQGDGYPHLSPSHPSPADVAFATQYVRDNHLSPEAYPIVFAANTNHYHAAGHQSVPNSSPMNDPSNNGDNTSSVNSPQSNNPVQNVGMQQPHQRPHPGCAPPHPNPNAPNLPRPSENVYHDPPQTPLQNPNNENHDSYYSGKPATTPNNDATPPTPVKREHTVLNRALGPKASTPLEDCIKPLVAALKALPPVNKKDNHPNRKTLKKPFTHIDVATPGQLLIRDNFLSGQGTIRPESKLLGWFGDEAVFEREFWIYLVEGKPRGVSGKRKRGGGDGGDGGGDRVKKQKSEEQGEDEGTG